MKKPPPRPTTPPICLTLLFAALGPFSLLTLTTPLPAATISTNWSGATGDWLDPAQWSPIGVPSNNINNTYIPTIDTGAVTLAGTVTLSGLTLGTSATLTLAPTGSLTLLSGGPTPTSLAGTIDLQNGALFTLQDVYTPSLNSLTVTGPGIFSTALTSNDSLALTGNVVISNLRTTGYLTGSGTLTITSSMDFRGTGGIGLPGGITIAPGASFTNDIAGSGTFNSPFRNSGSTTLTSGLQFLGPITNTALFNIGTPTSPTGTLISFKSFTNSGTFTLTRGTFSQLSGGLPFLNTGLLSQTGGTLNLTNATNSGTFSLSPLTNATASTLTLTQGSLITGAGSLTASAVFVQGSATASTLTFRNLFALDPDASLHITGNSGWNPAGSATAAVPITIDPGATLAMTPGSVGAQLNAPLTNNGTISPTHLIIGTGSLLNNGLLSAGSLTLNAAASVTNNATASIFQLSLGPAASFTNNGLLTLFTTTALTGGTITNAGIWNHTANNNTVIPATFNNAGTLSLSNTIFSLAGGGTSSGLFTATTGTLVLSAPYTLAAGARLSSNTASISAQSTLTLADLIPASGFLLGSRTSSSSPGFLTGPGTLDLSGFNLLASGTVANLGLLHVLASGSLTLGGTSVSFQNIRLSNTTLLNDGTIALLSDPSSTLTLQNAASILNRGTATLARSINAPDLSSTFINEALVNATAAAALATPFHNTGSLTFAPASTGTLTLAGGGTASGYFSVTAGNTILFANNYLLNNATLTGTGKYAGSVTLAGNTSLPANAAFSSISGTGTLNLSSQITASTTFGAGIVVALLPGASFSNTPSQSVTLAGATLRNETSIFPSTFSFHLTNGGTFLNTGYVSFSANPAPFASDNNPANALINTGTLALAIPTNVSIPVPLFNTGTLTVTPSSNFVTFSAGGTSSGTILANASLAFSGPHTFKNLTLNYTSPISTPTSLLSQISLEGNTTAYSTTIANGLAGPGTLTASGTSWSGGTLTNTGGIQVSPTITKTFLISLTATANFAITGTGLNSSTKVLDATTLTIPPDSTAFWSSSSSPRADALTFRNGAQVINQGTFSVLLTTSTINTDGNPNNALYNSGNFIVNHNSGFLTLTIPFHNTGVVTVSSGSVDFAAGYFDDDGTPDSTGDLAFTGINTGLAFSNHLYNFGPTLDLGLGSLRGAGTLTSALFLGGTLAVAATSSAVGTLTLLAPAAGAGSLSVPAQRTLVAPAVKLASASISGALLLTPGAATSRFSTLTLAADSNGTFTSHLELADNLLILDPGSSNKSALLATIRAAITQGTTDTLGITSSTTAADPLHKITVAVDNALLNLTSFGGLPVGFDSLLIESTWLGDSNLDRRVDVSDLGTLATYYGKSVPWGPLNGDFNNDGTVNVSDLGLLATNYGQGTAPGTPFPLEPSQLLITNYQLLSTPEPTTLTLLLPPLLLRRARRQRRPTTPPTP